MFKRTPEADSLLAQRSARGGCAAQIGARLGVSKSAVIGRARRVGVRLDPTPAPRLAGLTILDLTPETCRFPRGDPRAFERFRSCGAPATSGRVDCDDHHARCHRAEHRRERRELALVARALAP